MEHKASFVRPKIWEIFPDSFKKIEILKFLKREIETRKPGISLCTLGNLFVQNLGSFEQP